jgi:hypothetical protein
MRTVLAATPVVEQELAEAGAFDPLQELLGDDLIGVDVGPIERDDFPFVSAEWLHCLSLSLASRRAGRRRYLLNFQFLISVKWPATAAAAAIIGLTR